MAASTFALSLTIIGWLVAPIISFLVNKFLSYLNFNLSRKLWELERQIIPSLEERIDVTEQRMLSGAKDEGMGSESRLRNLGALAKDLKSALYEAADVLDDVNYRRIQRSVGTSISWLQNINHKFRYLGFVLQGCALGLFFMFLDLVDKLEQYAQNLKQMFRDLPLRVRAKLVQCVQSLNMYIHKGTARQPPIPDASAAEFTGDIESHGRAMELVNLEQGTTAPRDFIADIPYGSAEEAPSNSHSLARMICYWLAYGFSALRSFYFAARRLRDWSYAPVGIKNDDNTATDCVLSINEVISLRKRIKNIECTVSADTESSSFTIKNSAGESSEQKEIDRLYRSIKQKVFGRDKDRAHISTMLREGPDSVIVIYGITGSGKSTLAQYVCDHEKRHFDPIMFILVGKAFSVGDIFRDMLDQITQSQPSKDKDLRSLKNELEEKLKDKCFLLVLDDLWVNSDNIKERLILLDVLAGGQSGSRILVTAQKKDAAAGLGGQKHIQIPDLEGDQYLSMFMHYAQVSRVTHPDYEKYEAIGRKILKKLGTSVIAARTVAARLQSSNSIHDWQTTADNDVLNETMGALRWSYLKLGVDIRRCFAYCSTFPRGYELDRDDLVRIWIAQGFVNTRSNATEELEDVGQRYFDELLTFSFLQAERKNSLMIFRIHDLLHEFAERVSGSEFCRIDLNGLPEDIPPGVHHLSIETNNVAEIVEKIPDLGNLRTLIINEDFYAERVERNHDLENALGRLFTRPRKLRVLIIKLHRHINEVSVPVSICEMKHLRYLYFACSVSGLILPSTFSKLYHIQVIDTHLSNASYPEDMANLICLRHIPGYLSCPIPNIGRLTSLQTLTSFQVTDGQGYGLKQLKHLNKLGGTLCICGLEIVESKQEALEAHLTHKKRLSTLLLDFGWEKRFDPDVEAEVLEGLCPPKDLQELLIDAYKGSRYPSWMFSRHHSEIAPKHLHTLELRCCSQLVSIPEGSELFIGLRELGIKDCDWDRLPENMEGLQSLQTLEIFFCHSIQLLPKLPVQSLNKIIIKYCGVLSATCKEEGHENWCKIQQIPEKEIK